MTAQSVSRGNMVVTAAIVSMMTGLLLLWLTPPLSPDVTGQLWIAKRLLGGARLYVDIVEINPPLWFWLAMPVQVIAAALAVAPEHVLIVATGFAAWVALAATMPLLAMPRPERCRLLAYTAALLLLMPASNVGQREQLALICALPLVALAAARAAGREVPSWNAVAIGIGAALGLLLKHYFLLAPIALETWLAVTLHRRWRPWRPELLAFALVGLGYAAAVVFVTPAYLTDMVPDLRLAYSSTDATDWRAMIGPNQVIWILIGGVLILSNRKAATSPLQTATLVAAAAFAAGWWLQHKTWPYQSMVVTGMLAVALAVRPVPSGGVRRLLHASALALPLALALLPNHVPIPPSLDIAPSLYNAPRGSRIAIVSTEGFTSWPIALSRDFHLVGRYPQYWQLRAIDARADDVRVVALGHRLLRRTLADYRCAPPEWLIFIRPIRESRAAVDDPLRFFLQNPDFAAFLHRYRLTERHGVVDTLRPRHPIAPDPTACHRPD